MTPNGWRTITFGDAASLAYGKSLPAAQRKNGVVPVCGANGIIGFHDEPLARGPGIIVGRKGSVGAVTWVDKDFWPIDTTYYVKSKEPSDARWLYYAVSNLGLDKLNEATGIPGLNRSTAAAVTFYVPPLPEQRKIAAILSSLDDAIEKTQAVIDQVQVVKRGLMQELLSRGLPGRHTRFKQTEIGEIPEEWEVRALVDCCNGKGQYGANVAKADFKPGGIRYIRITDIDDNGALRDNAVGISGENADGYLLQLGDILFARSGATVGKAYMHRDPGMRSAFAGYLVRFRTKRDVLLPMFLREYLNTDVYWRWVGDRQRAQAQPNINATEYGQLPVPCAPLDEQRRVMEIAESFNSSLLRARAEVLGKQWLKRALMPVLLTGELRVTPGPEVA